MLHYWTQNKWNKVNDTKQITHSIWHRANSTKEIEQINATIPQR